MVQFSQEPLLEFSFRRHTCLEHALDDIAKTQFTGGSENQLSRAIEKVMRFAFTTSRVGFFLCFFLINIFKGRSSRCGKCFSINFGWGNR